ncbi:MAG: oxygen-independent coproporphyrinogen III oxidase [Myxococcota bacterium]|nr:oxygen-independent coproporphyrinogen III oxidase [Myxococcota bacterium]
MTAPPTSNEHATATPPDFERLEALLPRYELAGPRYTSYPTVPVWREDFGPDDFASALGRATAPPDAGLAMYVHIPFCNELCHYCACNRVITRNEALPVRYLETIEREVAAVQGHLPDGMRIGELHLGGGTPTHLDPGQLESLISGLDRAFGRTDDAELSIEVDPRVTTEAHIDTLRRCGFRRISLGVQDFDPKVQKAVHRIQPPEQVTALTNYARSQGFESVNFDLIYGLPHQDVKGFDATLDHVFELAPDRVALYSYAHVTWIAKQQRGFERMDLPSGDEKLRIMLHAMRRFVANDYVHIGMDHFAKRDDTLGIAAARGELRRNFMGYTTRAPGDLVALGPSAISMVGGCFAQSLRGLDEWKNAIAEHGLATFRGHTLSEDDERRAWVIEAIMCGGAVRATQYREQFGRDFKTDFASELAATTGFVEDELLDVADDGSLAVTPTGSMLLRNLAMCFDAYLPAQHQAEKPMFSKTI